MFWAPHWELIGANANADEQQALANIAAFADGQAGVMAECASIAAFEGASPSAPNMNAFSSTSQFQTCSSSSCGHVSVGLEVNTDPSDNNSAGPFSTDALRNCTDPDLANGSPCAYFASPGDAFAQIGDYRFNALQSEPSTVADFKPAPGAKYRDGVLPLVSGIASLDRTKLASAATVRTMAGFKGEFVTRNSKDNSPAKSNIIYLGIHDETSSIAGTKIALQTLLLLGDPPVVTTHREVTRSSPIIAQVGTNQVIVQGTYESITPAPTTRTATTEGEVSAFEFPYLIGHLRAIKTASVGTSEVDFNALADSAIAFEEAIPAATASGCGSNFAGTCRTVFTHTTGGQRPQMRFVKTSGADFTAIKDLIAPGITSQATVVARILAGIPDGSGGYTSKLGGIDRSTAAVIGTSNLVPGGGTRPQMIYVGAADGMLHAFCAKAVSGTGCNVDGRELWAFIPRVNLPRLRKNTARIDGSPRVIDMFGDFDPTDGQTIRSFRTVLLFQTGTGDPAVSGETPAVYALDVTDPFNPSILWEYTTPATRAVTDFGQGITVTAGRTKIGNAIKNVAFVQTNNGGTGTSGTVVTAIDVETGLVVWQHGQQYPAPRVTASGTVPSAGIPGGAIPIDRTGGGTITDVVFGTLYGDLYRLDATTGTNVYGTNPLFRFSADKKPFGAVPTVYSNGDPDQLFVANVSGGYFDPFALALWSDSQQYVVAMPLATAVANTPLNEGSSGLAFAVALGAGEKGFAQAVVVGNQLFVTTDTTDINAATFGSAASGKLYRMDLATGGNTSSVTIAGGGGSIASSSTTLYASSGAGIGQLLTNANNANNASTNANPVSRLSRRLWVKST
jgi:Tfp pilus tip-associated adhesin PilY1